MTLLLLFLAGLATGAVLVESFHATAERGERLREARARRAGHATVLVRRRLTVDGARALGLEVVSVPTPWAESGETYALVDAPHAPCQECWHRRDEHEVYCLSPSCRCFGWDPFLDTEERAARV